jgi:hypothetical protein
MKNPSLEKMITKSKAEVEVKAKVEQNATTRKVEV